MTRIVNDNRNAVAGGPKFRRAFCELHVLHHSARLVQSQAPAATLLIRIMIGAVFLSEGLQKFLYPAARGAGRFVNMVIPFAHRLKR